MPNRDDWVNHKKDINPTHIYGHRQSGDYKHVFLRLAGKLSNNVDRTGNLFVISESFLKFDKQSGKDKKNRGASSQRLFAQFRHFSFFSKATEQNFFIETGLLRYQRFLSVPQLDYLTEGWIKRLKPATKKCIAIVSYSGR